MLFVGIMVAIPLCAAEPSRSRPQVGSQRGAAEDDIPFTPGGKYRRGDINRPRPAVIDPGTESTEDQPGRPPSDAVVLFDGKDLSHWETVRHRNGKREILPANWKVQDGYMEVETKTRTGSIYSKEKFGDCQIHVEWATPAKVEGRGQGRGNSGILLEGHTEIQVLDSYHNDTYPDGQAAALYHRYPPLVNASRGPGQWQTFDIVFEAPRLDAKGHLTKPARITVFHNGILVHHAMETGGTLPEIKIGLQDHTNPVRFRNVWVRRLRGYDAGPEKQEKSP